MKELKFIDVNGTGHSGKSAVTDLLREFEKNYLYDHLFEFDFVRIPGGILELKYNFYDNWSPIRADHAISKFLKTSKRMSNSIFSYDLFRKINSYGTNYETIFNNKFELLTNQYCLNLIEKKIYREYWPYRLIDKSTTFLFLFKFLRKLKLEKVFFKNFFNYNVTLKKDFIKITNVYLNSLFNELYGLGEKHDTILLQNTFEPYNPDKSLKIFKNIKLINVIRDPRDIYCSTLKINPNEVFIPEFIKEEKQWDFKKRFLSTNNIEDFILIQKMNLRNLDEVKSNKDFLNIKYEDLVLNYNQCLIKITSFLKIDLKDHKLKKAHFDPKKSIKNVGVWKNYKNTYEVKLIEKELKEYCYQK